MSAFVVGSGHIDVMVAALVAYRVIDADRAVAVGADLWQENYASVNYRYGEDETPPPYRSTPAAVEELHPVAVLKAADCYEYQSCEHPGWKDSTAAGLVALLRLAVLDAHPDLAGQIHRPDRVHDRPAYTAQAVYDTAPWGFDTLAQAYASAYAT